MILEKFFTKKAETKTAKNWMTALETREVQKNSYRATGDLKASRRFAAVMSHEVFVPAQIPDNSIKPIEIFSKNRHSGLSRIALVATVRDSGAKRPE